MNSLNPDVLPNGLIKAGNNRYIKPIDKGLVFYSYSTPVIVIQDSKVYKSSDFYSVTTSRHCNEFLKSIGCVNPEIVSQDVINSFAE